MAHLPRPRSPTSTPRRGPEAITKNIQDITKLEIQANFSEASARLTEGEMCPEGLDIQFITHLSEQIAVPFPPEYAADPREASGLHPGSSTDGAGASVTAKEEVAGDGSLRHGGGPRAAAQPVAVCSQVMVVEGSQSQSEQQEIRAPEELLVGAAPGDLDETQVEAPDPPSEQ